ncbi:MAG: hypothetical protein GY953_33580, partial [bacterium]|nr:hypothetical protein [bacterium]
MDPLIWLYLAIVAAVAALALAGFFARQVNAADPGNETMVDLMGAIREGAMTFIRREYTAVAGFVVILAILIGVLLDWGWPWGWIAYIFGAVLSALAGFIGMRIATAANARTAEAARTGGINAALPLAFRGGAVMGFTVAGLGMLSFSVWLRRTGLERYELRRRDPARPWRWRQAWLSGRIRSDTQQDNV